MLKNIAGIFFVSLLISACGDNNDRIKENAQIQGAESARKSVEAENANRDSRVQKAEQDLEKRRRFIDALVGKYSGTMENDRDRFPFKILIGSSLPPYTPPERVRSLEEVTFDLNNLFVNIQTSILMDDGTGIGGCAYEGIRPSFSTGMMTLISEKCFSSYELQIANSGDPEAGRALRSDGLPDKILTGTVREVLFITGKSQSRFGAAFKISLRRDNSVD